MSAYSDLILLDRPVAYWPLTESGTAIGATYADVTGHGYDVAVREGVLTHSPGPVGDTTAPYFPDLGATAPYFDALVGHTTLGLPLNGMAYTLEGWMKPQAEPDIGWMQWIGYGPGADAGHDSTKFIGSDILLVGSDLLSSPPNQIQTSNVSNGVSTTVATLLTDGAWHHIVITDDAGRTTCFYVDGVLVAALDNGGFGNGVTYYADNLLILGCPGNDNGAFPANSLVENEPYVGGLAHCAVYGRALTPCEVKSHYYTALDGSAYAARVLLDNPVAYVPFTEASGTTFTDVTGNGHDVSGPSSVLQAAAQPGPLGGTMAVALLNGTTWATVGNAATLVVRGAFSFEWWTRYDFGALTNDCHLQVFGDTNVTGLGFQADGAASPHRLSYFGYNDAIEDDSPWISSGLDGWHHGVFTCDGTTVRLYRDGLPLGGPYDATGWSTTFTPLGAHLSTGNATVYLAHLALYAYALSPCQVQSHYTLAGPAAFRAGTGTSYEDTILARSPSCLLPLTDTAFTVSGGQSYLRDAGTHGYNGQVPSYSLSSVLPAGDQGALVGEGAVVLAAQPGPSAFNDQIDLPAGAFPAIRGSWTVEVWLKFDESTLTNLFTVYLPSAGGPFAELYVLKNPSTSLEQVGFYANTTGLVTMPWSHPWCWHSYCATFDGTTLTAYRDGVTMGTLDTSSWPFFPVDAPVGVALWTERVGCAVNYFAVYPTVLSAGDVAANYAAAAPRQDWGCFAPAPCSFCLATLRRLFRQIHIVR